jgi:hypothetical protein
MAAPNLATRLSATVVIPNDGASHSLYTLLLAIQPIAPPRTRWMTVQVDSASAGSVLFGDGPINEDGSTNPAALTSTMYGLKMTTASPTEYWYGIIDENYTLPKFYVMASGGIATIHVQIIRA